MIAQEQKPMEEILGYLAGKKDIIILGCGGCATFYHTGDKKAVTDLAAKLEKEGKTVTKINLPFGMQACDTEKSGVYLEKARERVKGSDAILVMSCGDGVQVVTDFTEHEMGILKPVYPANNALGLVGGGPTKFKETCLSCGMCELGKTAGICPLTSCGKGLMNGPCGGVRVDNKCEIDPEKECAWVRIYERMEKLGELDKFIEMRAPHEWSKCLRPRLFEIEEPLGMLEMMGCMLDYNTVEGYMALMLGGKKPEVKAKE